MMKTVLTAVVVASISLTAALPARAQDQAQGQAQASREEILSQAQDRAASVVLDAFNSDDPRQRMAAIEAVQDLPERAQPMAQIALSDENPAVRFAALVTIGRLELDALGPAALDLIHDENISVRAAALFAAHQCGEQVDLSLLGRMLGSSDLGARGNAVMLLGLIGDPAAMPMLEEMFVLHMPRAMPAERAWIHIQFAEAMLRIDPDDVKVLNGLRASAYSDMDDVRVLALQVIGEVQDRAMIGWLEGLLDNDNPMQVKVAAARALARMDRTEGRALLMRAASYSAAQVHQQASAFLQANPQAQGREIEMMRQLVQDPEAQEAIAADVRSQAVLGLGALADRDSARKTVEMLEDAQPVVRLAAAACVLK